jgi:hypothetical protein
MIRISAGLGRSIDRMPPGQVNVLLGTLLGRALAHELGHYLLRSSAHTGTGLMRGRRTIHEFIAPGRKGFDISTEQQLLVASGLDLVNRRAD